MYISFFPTCFFFMFVFFGAMSSECAKKGWLGKMNRWEYGEHFLYSQYIPIKMLVNVAIPKMGIDSMPISISQDPRLENQTPEKISIPIKQTLLRAGF